MKLKLLDMLKEAIQGKIEEKGVSSKEAETFAREAADYITQVARYSDLNEKSGVPVRY